MNIDPDKVAETPGLLPYAHHVGSAIIKPLDKGRAKELAMSAMYEQTGVQLNQLKKQVEMLVAQAQTIHGILVITSQGVLNDLTLYCSKTTPIRPSS